jgi:hypothetical protein
VSWNLSNALPATFITANTVSTPAKIAYNGSNKYIVHGYSSATTAVSTDAITWTAGSSPSVTGSASAFAYGLGRFVRTNESNTNNVHHSTDGVSWTTFSITGVLYINDLVAGKTAGGTDIMVGVGAASGANGFIYSYDAQTWVVASMPGTNWYAASFGSNSSTGDSRFVAVGDTSNVAYSVDGVIWTSTTKPNSTTWHDVEYFDNQFVAVQRSSANAYTSTDGITWTSRSLTNSATWNALISKNQAYTSRTPVTVPAQPITMVTLDDKSLTNITTDGITWTAATQAVGGAKFEGLYDGSKFVAAGRDSVIYSTNGVSWNLSNALPATFITANTVSTPAKIAYNGSNKYIVHGYSSATTAVSTDAITWTAGSSPSVTGSASAFAYGLGRFVRTNESNTNNVHHSTDGVSWTTFSITGVLYINDLVAGKTAGGTDIMVGVGAASGANGFIYSYDAQTWVVASMPGTNWYAASFGSNSSTGDSRFVAVGDTSNVAYSVDGVIWTSTTKPNSTTWYDVEYFDNQFVAVQRSSANAYTSTDGITWTSRSLTNSATWNALISKNQAYTSRTPVTVPAQPITMVTLDDQSLTNITTDGITWTAATQIAGGAKFEGLYDGSKFVAVGKDRVIYSTNGVSWNLSNALPETFVTVNTNPSTMGIAYNGSNKYIMTSRGSTITAISTDAITWTAGSTPSVTIGSYGSFGYGLGRFVRTIDQSSSNLLHSTDGVSWIALSLLNGGLEINDLVVGKTAGGADIMVGVGRAASTSGFIYSYDAQTWVLASMPGNIWYAAAFGSNSSTGDSRFVAVGDTSNVAYSVDGVVWTSTTKPNSTTWYDVEYFDNQFVAVQRSSANAYTSTDGITWTSRSLTNSATWNALISKNQAYTSRTPVTVPAQPITMVTLDDQSLTNITTDGITWTAATQIAGGAKFEGLYDGSKFVAVGKDRVIYSTNGVSWNLSNALPETFVTVNTNPSTMGIAYNGSNKYIMTSRGSTITAISTDAITWTAGSTPSVTIGSYGSFGYGLGRFVRTIDQSSSHLIHSTDGVSWTALTLINGGLDINDLAVGKTAGGADIMVGVGRAAGTSGFIYSYDAQTWVLASMPGNIWYAATFGSNSSTQDSRFVAVGDTSNVAYSVDGVIWTSTTKPNSTTWHDVEYFDNQFVAVQRSSANAYTSTDGITWTSRSLTNSATWTALISKNQAYTTKTPVSVPAQPITMVTLDDKSVTNITTDGITWTAATQAIGGEKYKGLYDGSKFVAAGRKSVIYSTNGVSWNLSNLFPATFITANTNPSTMGIAYNGSNKYIITAQASTVTAVSTNGITWTVGSSPSTTGSGSAFKYGLGRFVRASSTNNNPNIHHSTDGITWTGFSNPTGTLSINDFAVGKNLSAVDIMVGVGTRANIGSIYSYDAQTWSRSTIPAANTTIYNAVAFGNNTFVAVGNSWDVALSADGITWTLTTKPNSTVWYDIEYVDNQFVSVERNSANAYTSTDGINWTLRTLSASSNWSLLISAKADGVVEGGIVARGVFGGGYQTSNTNTMSYITISSQGDATDFGDLTVARYAFAGCSSTTRGVFGGGFSGSSNYNTMDYITIATTGNAIDFGDLTAATKDIAACSSTTRGVFGGGYTGDFTNTMEYITIATTGNAIDFGDLTAAKSQVSACSSTTRGVFAGSSPVTNSIDYITIATTANATSFGDLTIARQGTAACSSTTRGVFGGGNGPSNVIDYITIATTGNATDFGDLNVARRELAACSSTTRGIFGGGYGGSNTLDYITIATTANATSFGDLTEVQISLAALSNAHGGLG